MTTVQLVGDQTRRFGARRFVLLAALGLTLGCAPAHADSVQVTAAAPSLSNPYGWATVWTPTLDLSMPNPSSRDTVYLYTMPGENACAKNQGGAVDGGLISGATSFLTLLAAADGKNRLCAEIRRDGSNVPTAVSSGLIVTNGVAPLKSPSSFRCGDFASPVSARTYFTFYGIKPLDWEAHGNRCEYAGGPWAAGDPETPTSGWRQFLPAPAPSSVPTAPSVAPVDTAASAATALRTVLLGRFGRSLRRGSRFRASCNQARVGFACTFSWKYRRDAYKGTASVARVQGKLKVSWRATRRASGKCRRRCSRTLRGATSA